MLYNIQGVRGHSAVYYTSPQSLIRWLNNLGDFYCILVGCFIKLSVQPFQTLIIISRRGNLCEIIRDVQQFLGHCLIPLDPCLDRLILEVKQDF